MTLETDKTLAEFLGSAGKLTLDERRLIVDQALVLFEDNYVHMPLKAAMHAVNPIQRLRNLRSILGRLSADKMGPEWQFHKEISSVFHSVRDLHTNYLLPAPFAGNVAYVPFMIEKSRDNEADHYLVTQVAGGFSAPGFGRGVEVTYWNGMRIERAIALNGEAFAGSNEAANLSRGIDSLTLRPLNLQLPPDEETVTLEYVADDGSAHELRVPWRVVENQPPMTDHDSVSTEAGAQGLDLDSDEKTRARKVLYVPKVVALEEQMSGAAAPKPEAVDASDVATSMPGVFRARTVQTSHGTFGHLRVFTFSVRDPIEFRDEFVRLAGLLPQEGLIVDVRDNGGGLIYAAEFTLQTLTPRRISPEPVQFLSSDLNLRICERHKDNPSGIDLGPWYESLYEATQLGSTFSAAFPITPEEGCNAIGQTYHGPAVLITDARCYSATDIFAAGWADHEVGPILGVDETTGAGGANVWTHGLLSDLERVPQPDQESPYQPLPLGANMRVAIRRSLRVGKLSGTPVEDLGVKSTEIHPLTRDDVLNGNADLLDRAGELLAAQPARKLDVTAELSGTTLTLGLATSGLDRADVFVADRPRASADLTDTATTVTVEGVQPSQQVLVQAYSGGQLAAARLMST
jgi:Peptidase family S41